MKIWPPIPINCLFLLNPVGHENEQYLLVAEQAQSPNGNAGVSKLSQVFGKTVEVVETGDVVDGGNVGRHLNPSRDSNPTSKSYLRKSDSHFGSILSQVQ